MQLKGVPCFYIDNATITITFDLCTCRTRIDTFALVMSFGDKV